jgi:hypothetical protein
VGRYRAKSRREQRETETQLSGGPAAYIRLFLWMRGNSTKKVLDKAKVVNVHGKSLNVGHTDILIY